MSMTRAAEMSTKAVSAAFMVPPLMTFLSKIPQPASSRPLPQAARAALSKARQIAFRRVDAL
jgi:hypothetical protein